MSKSPKPARNQTSPLLATDRNGLGLFRTNQGRDPFDPHRPGTLFINDPSRTGLSNEQFKEKWEAAFGSTTPGSKTCSFLDCTTLHPTAAVEIDKLVREGRLDALVLQNIPLNNSQDNPQKITTEPDSQSMRLLVRYGVEPLTADEYPCAAGTDDAGYFTAKWGSKSLPICFRNRPMDTGISNDDVSERLEDAFPQGTIAASQSVTGLAYRETDQMRAFINEYLKKDKVELYIPVGNPDHDESVATSITSARAVSILHRS